MTKKSPFEINFKIPHKRLQPHSAGGQIVNTFDALNPMDYIPSLSLLWLGIGQFYPYPSRDRNTESYASAASWWYNLNKAKQNKTVYTFIWDKLRDVLGAFTIGHYQEITCCYQLTHWGCVTQICIGNITIICSYNGLSPDWRQAIIWTNAGLLLLEPLGTEILILILAFSFKKMHFNVSSVTWQPFCHGLNVSTLHQVWCGIYEYHWCVITHNHHSPVVALTTNHGKFSSTFLQLSKILYHHYWGNL